MQDFVREQEEAVLAARLRHAAQGLARVTGQILQVDSQLTTAQQQQREATVRLGMLQQGFLSSRRERQRERQEQRRGGGGQQPGTKGQRRPPLLGPWGERLTLLLTVLGITVFVAVLAQDTGLPGVLLVLLPLAAGVGTVAAAQIVARSLDRVALLDDGRDRPGRRRALDLAVSAGAMLSSAGMLVALTRWWIDPAAASFWPATVGVALLGVTVATSYAATPGDPGASRRWWATLRRLLAHLRDARRNRLEVRRAAAEQRAWTRAVGRLREDLASLAGQLRAAEADAVQAWHQQVALGDGAQHMLAQHLLELGAQRRRGWAGRTADWWRGNRAVEAPGDLGLVSIRQTQPTWPDEVAHMTRPARDVLVRHELLGAAEAR